VNESFRVLGADRFASTLKAAQHDITTMEVGFAEAGRIIAAASAATAPVRTGALRASIHGEISGSNRVYITSPLIYSSPVHWGRPAHHIHANLFILRGADASEAEWSRAIERNAQTVCDSVQGV
jgi:hypothetical protein